MRVSGRDGFRAGCDLLAWPQKDGNAPSKLLIQLSHGFHLMLHLLAQQWTTKDTAGQRLPCGDLERLYGRLKTKSLNEGDASLDAV